MKKHKVDGPALREQREKRALTQEELSEKTQLGVRTLRRLEAGQGTLETLKRVNEALAREPEVLLEPTPEPGNITRELLRFDLVCLEVSAGMVPLVTTGSPLLERIKSIRRHLALENGFVVPGIRLRDNSTLAPHTYVIKVREMVVATGELRPGKVMVVAPEDVLSRLGGERTTDPTYGMAATWVDAPGEEVGRNMTFDWVSLIAVQLTEVLRVHAHRLLGVDEVQDLLDYLDRPALVKELVDVLSLGRLRAVLCRLLEQRVSIRDLGLILETLLDDPTGPTEALTERARVALRRSICQEYARSGEIQAIAIEADYERRLEANWDELSAGLEARLVEASVHLETEGRQPIVVSSPRLRPLLQSLSWRGSYLVCLSRAEIPDQVTVSTRVLLKAEPVS